MRYRTHLFIAMCLLLASVLLSGCSPEAGRVRSGGPGADVGNRSATVDMHANTNPSYQEPAPGRAIQTERNAGK